MKESRNKTKAIITGAAVGVVVVGGIATWAMSNHNQQSVAPLNPDKQVQQQKEDAQAKFDKALKEQDVKGVDKYKQHIDTIENNTNENKSTDVTTANVKADNEKHEVIKYVDLGGHSIVQGPSVENSNSSITGTKSNNNSKTAIESAINTQLVTYVNGREGQVEIHDGYLNVREQPTTSSAVVAHLANNTKVSVKGYRGNWILVSVNGKQGYVFNKYMHIEVPTQHVDNNTNSNKDNVKPSQPVKPTAPVEKPTEPSKPDEKPVTPPAVVNNAPVITASDVVLTQGENFSADMLHALAMDKEDGNITKDIVQVGKVDTSKAGVYDIKLEVADSQGAVATKIVKVTVKEKEIHVIPPTVINHAPVISGHDVVIDEGTAFNVKDLAIKAFDFEDGDITSAVKVVSNNVNTAKPGVYNVKVQVTDKQGAKFTKEFKVTVKEVIKPSVINNAPVIKGHGVTIEEGQKFDIASLGLSASDKEDGNLTQGIKIVKNDVNTAKAGTYDVVVKVTDKQGASCTQTFKVVVNKKAEKPVPPAVINACPTIEGHDVTVDQGAKFNIANLGLTASDKEDGNLTSDIKVVENNVDTAKAGTYTVKVEVQDNQGAKAVKEFKVTVKAVEKPVTPPAVINAVPEIEGHDTTITEGTKFDNSLLGLSAFDKEDGNITSSIKVDASQVNVDKVGSYKVVVTVADKDGAKATKDFTVTVKAKPIIPSIVNACPTIEGHNATILQGQKFSTSMLGLSAQDKEDGNLSDSIKVVSNNVDTNKVGTYEVKVQVTDSKGAGATKTFKVVVKEAPNTAPVINAEESVSLPFGSYWKLSDSKVSAHDKEDGTLSVVVTKNSVKARVPGTYHVTLEAKDSKGLVTTKTITVKIMAKAPTIEAHNVTINEGTKFTNSLVGLDAKDCTGRDLTEKVQVKGHVDTSKAGTYHVTYTVVDSFGLSSTKTITVTVKAKPVEGWSASSQAFHNAVAQKMYSLVNSYRQSKGVTPYEINQECVNAANWKSQDMTNKGYFDHKDPNGKQTWEHAGFENVQQENIAQRHFDKTKGLTKADADQLATELFNQWKTSAGHNAAMLNDWNTGIGFGFVLTDSGLVNATQDFC